MRIVSRVAAAFYRRDRTPIFEVSSRDLLVILDAPEEIRSDPLFDLLVREGSLQVITSDEVRKVLESDPVQGANAEGRKITVPDPDAAPAAPAPAKAKASKSA